MNKKIKHSALVIAFCSAVPSLASAALFDYPTSLNTPTKTKFTTVVTGDFNGDNNLDIIGAGKYAPDIIFYAGSSNGSFAPSVKSTLGTLGITQVDKGDFDGDGVLDLLLGHGNNGWSVSLGKGDGTFLTPTLNTMPIEPVSKKPYPSTIVKAVDLNADGLLDVVVAGGSDSHVFLGQGGTVFNAPLTTSYVTPVSFGDSVLITDLNADTIPDIAILYTSGMMGIATGVGDGTFSNLSTYQTDPVVAPALPVLPNGITAADFNGDAVIDIAVANYNQNNIGVFIGTGIGNASFYPVVNYSTLSLANSSVFMKTIAVKSGDFNGDGILDIACAKDNGGVESVLSLLGKGDGTFHPATFFSTTGVGATALAAGDFNSDGSDDLVLAANISPNLDVFLTPVPKAKQPPSTTSSIATPAASAAPASSAGTGSSSGGCLLGEDTTFTYLLLMVASACFRRNSSTT